MHRVAGCRLKSRFEVWRRRVSSGRPRIMNDAYLPAEARALGGDRRPVRGGWLAGPGLCGDEPVHQPRGVAAGEFILPPAAGRGRLRSVLVDEFDRRTPLPPVATAHMPETLAGWLRRWQEHRRRLASGPARPARAWSRSTGSDASRCRRRSRASRGRWSHNPPRLGAAGHRVGQVLHDGRSRLPTHGTAAGSRTHDEELHRAIQVRPRR